MQELVLYTPTEAGELLKMSPATLAKWRMTGEGPNFMKCGNRIRYPEHELKAFVTSKIIAHTGQTGA